MVMKNPLRNGEVFILRINVTPKLNYSWIYAIVTAEIDV